MEKTLNIACIWKRVDYERFMNFDIDKIKFIYTDEERKLIGQNIVWLIKLSDIDNDITRATFSRMRGNYYE